MKRKFIKIKTITGVKWDEKKRKPEAKILF